MRRTVPHTLVWPPKSTPGPVKKTARSPLWAKLGKYEMGKGCVWIKRLADVDLEVLEQLVREGGTPVHLTIVGDGPERARLERRVRRTRLEPVVTVTGRVAPAAVRDHLARSDVYVAPAVLDSTRCISYLMIEVRGASPRMTTERIERKFQ